MIKRGFRPLLFGIAVCIQEKNLSLGMLDFPAVIHPFLTALPAST
jgi:hypothetical protein